MQAVVGVPVVWRCKGDVGADSAYRLETRSQKPESALKLLIINLLFNE